MATAPFSPMIHTVVETIQTALAPVFLLAAIAQMLNVLTNRLARVVDRARALEALHPRSEGREHDRYVRELRLLDRRMWVINGSLYLAVTSAIMICLVVATLFIGELGNWRVGRIIAVAFICAMLMLVASLVMLMVEVHVSLAAIKIPRELLERERKGR